MRTPIAVRSAASQRQLSLVGHTGATEAASIVVSRNAQYWGLPQVQYAQPRRRVEFRSELDRFSQSGPRLIERALQPERRRQAHMGKIKSGITGARLPREFNRLLDMA
jgi:hypothetical protein